MLYSNFLDSCGDKKTREKLWELLQAAEREARWFGLLYGNWVNVIKVQYDENIMKWDNGILTIPSYTKNTGIMFRELFQSAYNKSPLWQNNPLWAHGFCAAFRYYLAKKINFPDQMIDHYNNNATKPDEELLKQDNRDWNILEGIPMLRIVNEAGATMEHYKAFWAQLNREKPILSNHFNFQLEKLSKENK